MDSSRTLTLQGFFKNYVTLHCNHYTSTARTNKWPQNRSTVTFYNTKGTLQNTDLALVRMKSFEVGRAATGNSITISDLVEEHFWYVVENNLLYVEVIDKKLDLLRKRGVRRKKKANFKNVP